MTTASDVLPQTLALLHQRDYATAASLLESAIADDPSQISAYWYLGLALLLQDQEEAAQSVWMAPMLEGTPEQVEQWTLDLAAVLHTEAVWLEQQGEVLLALVVRRYLREANPLDLDNSLQIVRLGLRTQTLGETELADLDVIPMLTEAEALPIPLVLEVLEQLLLLNPVHPDTVAFVTATVDRLLPHIRRPDAIATGTNKDNLTFSGQELTPEQQIWVKLATTIFIAAVKVGHEMRVGSVGAQLMTLCNRLNPNNLEIMRHLSTFYQMARDFQQGIAIAQAAYDLAVTLPDKVGLNYLILRGLLTSGGRWSEAFQVGERHDNLLRAMLAEQPLLGYEANRRLSGTTFIQPYLRDDLVTNRELQNGLSALCQRNLRHHQAERCDRYQQHQHRRRQSASSPRPLKIGYLCHCLRRHSVGWLARWLVAYCDRSRFRLFLYLPNSLQIQDPFQDWYRQQAEASYCYGLDSLEIADQIDQDEIDILLDLDSCTLDISREVMALKPAPVQVTWLGWDASGIPAIDYYIADPYVVPNNAQDHYSETLWRLPQTYLAVAGFEVGVPTLRRDQLDLPSDAVVYLSAQGGFKRHPDTTRLQMQILKAVPNSYLLVKGVADDAAIRSFFGDLADQVGISLDRLRFLPLVENEETHRANLAIADVVLDTYPYNGATTTMETLWMAIPLVTKVGQQFSARNSYTMMVNAGVEEGIAWTDEEYVNWGIRLGTEPQLRQQVSWKLYSGRQTAPLWNARQFTKQMEEAFEQMWQRYLDS